MASCSNCNRHLSCGCQKRKASDGKSVCASCAANYELKLKQVRQQIQQENSQNLFKLEE